MSNRTKHGAIDDTYHQRIEDLLYSRTDEKIVVSELLRNIFSNRRFKSVLDVGAGPGEITKPLASLTDDLTIVELLPEYEEKLRGNFPKARIIIDSIDNVSFDTKFDLILLSHVLYYFPEKDWMGLIERLHDTLLPSGELAIILLKDSGDWWNIISTYWNKLREHIRFDYIPLSRLKRSLSKLGPTDSYPFIFNVTFDSAEELAGFMGLEALQIKDTDILKDHHDDFVCSADSFKRNDGKYIISPECEIVVIKKS